MIYPLVRELAGDGIHVTVTCRVLKIARQPYYRWQQQPVTESEWAQAHLANALFDAHHDDPEFGYRFLADEAKAAWFNAAERTVWRICSQNGWFSAGSGRSWAGLVRQNLDLSAQSRSLDNLGVNRARQLGNRWGDSDFDGIPE